MNQQNKTKELIASTFKDLTNEKAIDKISITNIMKRADYRRQTFYDYFDDKYDLVTWIFHYDLSKLIQPIMSWENWERILFLLLNYLEENKDYYKKIFLNIKLDSFKAFFIYSIKQIFTKLTDDYFQEKFISINKTQITQTATDFYSYGLSETLYHWVLENCEPNSKIYHKMLVQIIEYRNQIK